MGSVIRLPFHTRGGCVYRKIKADAERPRRLMEEGRDDMSITDWRLQGQWVKNCNCAFGCPCDFNARPTHGHRRGLVAMSIQHGHFGDVRLEGLKFIAMVEQTPHGVAA